MRKVLLIGLSLCLLAGCDKLRGSKSKSGETSQPAVTVQMTNTANNGQPSVHAPTGVVINPGGGGGSGGAAQAVRKAAVRTVTLNELKNIQLFIENAAVSGQLPTKQQIIDALAKEDRKAYDLVMDGNIQLTGARNRETIWAFTCTPQSGGDHFVLSSNGIDRMNTATLLQRLQGQQGQ